MGRKRRGPRRAALDAYLTFAIFAVVGVATWRLDQLLRLTLMWLQAGRSSSDTVSPISLAVL